MKVSIGNDHGGYDLAAHLVEFLHKEHIEVLWHGTFSAESPVDYPDYAAQVGQDIYNNTSNFGILVCKTGIGMCIAANKIQGIRAANCDKTKMAHLARTHNGANILCLGAQFVTKIMAEKIVKTFINAQFSAGRHANRLQKISALETRRLP